MESEEYRNRKSRHSREVGEVSILIILLLLLLITTTIIISAAYLWWLEEDVSTKLVTVCSIQRGGNTIQARDRWVVIESREGRRR